MKKNGLSKLLMLGMFCLSTMSFASKANPVIAGIYKAGDQVWFIEEGQAAEKQVKSMGGKFIYIDAKMNPDTYLAAIDNVIAQKVDGVLVCVPEQQLSAVTIQKLKDAKIPVIAVDDPLIDKTGKKLAPWVGIDSYNIGLQVGEWLGKYAKQNKIDTAAETAVLVMTMDAVSSVVPRTQGGMDAFMKEVPAFPKNKIFKADYNGEADKAYSAASAIITANPKIKNWLVMGGNDEGVTGAVRALEQFGLDKTSTGIGMGAYLAEGEFKKSYSAYKAAPFFSPVGVGGTSAKLLIDFIRDGKAIPESTAVKSEIVTKENFKKVTGK